MSLVKCMLYSCCFLCIISTVYLHHFKFNIFIYFILFCISGLIRDDQSVIQVDDRIQSDGFNGTVRFIGVVPPTKGL